MGIQLDEFIVLFKKIGAVAPKAGLIILLLAAGWFLAFLVKILASKVLEFIRFNRFCDRVGLTEFIRKGQLDYTPSKLAGTIMYWIMLILMLFVVADIARVSLLDPLLSRVSVSLPKVMTAVLIGIIGYAVVSFLANFVSTIANNAAFPHTRLLKQGIKIFGIIFVITMAIQNMDINSKIIGDTFLILLAAAAFGLALAFGLGAKDMAKSVIERTVRNLEERNQKNSNEGDLEG